MCTLCVLSLQWNSNLVICDKLEGKVASFMVKWGHWFLVVPSSFPVLQCHIYLCSSVATWVKKSIWLKRKIVFLPLLVLHLVCTEAFTVMCFPMETSSSLPKLCKNRAWSFRNKKANSGKTLLPQLLQIFVVKHVESCAHRDCLGLYLRHLHLKKSYAVKICVCWQLAVSCVCWSKS